MISPTLDIPRGGDFDQRNVKYNLDGFGLNWYTNTRSKFDDHSYGLYPTLYKTTALPITDPAFISICGNSASKCFLAHVRAATLPPIVSTNNHPFVFGRHSFMHNGGISEFHKVRLEILKKISPEYAAMIYGNTDTEHLAALYFTYLGDIQKQYSAREMKAAMNSAVAEVERIQVCVLGKNTPNSMNLCATDGDSLVALRWRNSGDEPEMPPSLYVSYNAAALLDRRHHHNPWNATQIECTPEELTENAKPASEQLQQSGWNPHGPHVIVASEPANFIANQWSVLKNGQFIMVDLNENKMDSQQALAARVVDNVTDGGSMPVNGAGDTMNNKAITVTFDYLEK